MLYIPINAQQTVKYIILNSSGGDLPSRILQSGSDSVSFLNRLSSPIIKTLEGAVMCSSFCLCVESGISIGNIIPRTE